MLKTLIVITLFALGSAAAILGLTLRQNAYGTASLKGKPAPALALKTLDGKEASLANMKGQVVLIDLWATWCPPCRESLPHVQKLASDQALADKGLVVWAVNDGETKADVEVFMRENKYTFTVPLDETQAAHKAYLVDGIPTTVLIGRDGTVKETFLGYGGEATAKAIDAAVQQALAEK